VGFPGLRRHVLRSIHRHVPGIPRQEPCRSVSIGSSEYSNNDGIYVRIADEFSCNGLSSSLRERRRKEQGNTLDTGGSGFGCHIHGIPIR